MDYPAVVTLFVILTVITVLIRVNRATDFVVWGGVILLLAVPVPHDSGWQLGIINYQQAFSGLSNEGVITIVALFIIASGLRETELFESFAESYMGKSKSDRDIRHRIVWPTALFSGFVNNTPLVAIMVPVLTDWARRKGISVSRLLLPLSYASIFGGACTLMGTSTNLIVNGWIVSELDHPGFGLFTITIVAVPVAIIGLFLTIYLSGWLIPDRKTVRLYDNDMRQYTVEMIVKAGSRLEGMTIDAAGLRGLSGLYLFEINRGDEVLTAISGHVQLKGNDRLVFAGMVDSVIDLQKIEGLELADNKTFGLDRQNQSREFVEVVVSHSCPLLGTTVKQGKFRSKYNAAIIAVSRDGKHLNKKIGDISLLPGDTLLLDARNSFFTQHYYSKDFYLASRLDKKLRYDNQLKFVAFGILFSMVFLVAFKILPLLVAALLAAALMVVTGCSSASAARKSIDWEVVLVIAGAIGLGHAMTESGLASFLGNGLIETFGFNHQILLFAIMAMTIILANLITAKAGAVLMLPITLSAAEAVNSSYEPFVVAVMLASATAIASPIAYPTNLIIYGPGGYRYSDFLKVGGFITLIIWIASSLLIPVFWPFV